MENIWTEFTPSDPWERSATHPVGGLLLLQRLTAFPFVAGAGKRMLWIDVMRKSGLAALAMYYYDFRED